MSYYEELICNYKDSICSSCRKYVVCLDSRDGLRECDNYEKYDGKISDNNLLDVKHSVEEYIHKKDWRIAENANIPFSLSNLLLHLSGKFIANYWLNVVYENMHINLMHNMGLVHIHDLGLLSPYCFSGNTTIHINDKEYNLKEAFEELSGVIVGTENSTTKIIDIDDNVYTHNVLSNVKENKVNSITKYSNRTYKMTRIYLENNDKPIEYTNSHAVVIYRDNQFLLVRADHVKESDKLVKLKDI